MATDGAATAEQLDQSVNAVYEALLTHFDPCVRKVAVAGRGLVKSIQLTIAAYDTYAHALSRLGQVPLNSSPDTRKLGENISRIADFVQIQSGEQRNILQLSSRILDETDSYVKVDADVVKQLRRDYQLNQKAIEREMRKGKKSGVNMDIALAEHLKHLRIDNLRRALDEERKRYEFVINKHCELISRHVTIMQHLSPRAEDLVDIVRQSMLDDQLQHESSDRRSDSDDGATFSSAHDQSRRGSAATPIAANSTEDLVRLSRFASLPSEAQNELHYKPVPSGMPKITKRPLYAKIEKPRLLAKIESKEAVDDGAYDVQPYYAKPAEHDNRKAAVVSGKEPSGDSKEVSSKDYYEVFDMKRRSDDDGSISIGGAIDRVFAEATADDSVSPMASHDGQLSPSSPTVVKTQSSLPYSMEETIDLTIGETREFGPNKGPSAVVSACESEEIVEVVYDYSATGESQLSLRRGDRIQVLKTGELGWKYGLSFSTNRKGWFPQSYAKLPTCSKGEGAVLNSTESSSNGAVNLACQRNLATATGRTLHTVPERPADELELGTARPIVGRTNLD